MPHTPAGAGSATSDVTRIWTGRVDHHRSGEYEHYLRTVAVPALASRAGSRGVELLRSSDAEATEFTVVSHWDAAVGSTVRHELPGPGVLDAQDLAGTVTFHERVVAVVPEPVGPDPVDVGARTSVVAAVPRRPTSIPRAAVVVAGVVVASIVAVSVILGSATNGPEEGAPSGADGSGSAADAVAATSSSSPIPVSPQPVVAEFVPWPDPPEDHDPHVTGRPGPQVPVRANLEGWTLVYVNDQRRPTIVDLSTGDQRELVVAETRAHDVVLVEGGRVVVTAVDHGEFDIATPRAFAVTIVRDADAAPTSTTPGPVLCAAERGCLDRPWTSGRFGDDRSWIESRRAGTDPVVVLADLLGAQDRRTEGRWTTFAPGGDGIGEVRLPTPAADAVIWVLVELD